MVAAEAGPAGRGVRHDVIVIGGGVYGASILFWLARRGVDAVLLERAHLASGPTGRSSANIRLHYTTPELADLARRALEIAERFGELTGGDNGLVRVGMLYGLGPDLAPVFEANVRRLAAAGFAIELVDRGWMATKLPGFDLDGIVLGVWEPTTGYADPVGTTTGFADAARLAGATVRTNAAVARLLAAGGAVTGVELTSGEMIPAHRVIVAAGPWSRALLAGVGVDLPTFPERHAVTIADAPPAGARSLVPCVWSDRPNGYYARPEGEGSFILGGWTSGTIPVEDADRFEAAVPLAESAEHLAKAARRIPAIGGLGVRPGYASVYDVSPDRLPIVGPVPAIRGLYVAAGTSGHGFKLAPAIGEEVARLVVEGSSELLRPFALDRTFGSFAELSA